MSIRSVPWTTCVGISSRCLICQWLKGSLKIILPAILFTPRQLPAQNIRP